MTMSYTPLDSSFQCASFETKKFDLAFFVEEKFTKNQKTPIFGSHTDKWGLWPELSLCLTSTHRTQELTVISFESATKKIFEKTTNPYLLSNLHPEKTFKRP
jgi:hypothetical protein